MLIRRYLTVAVLCLCSFIAWGQDENTGFNDGIDRSAEDFVTVSLMIASPGDVLYSCVGHAALRMQCPQFGLDNVYSYESEGVSNRILAFFAGNLKMGMFNIPFNEYLDDYVNEGRGVKQYKLNLPPKVEQELWRILDEEVDKGPYLEYNFLTRGCAQSIVNFIELALGTSEIDYGVWDEKYNQTRREFVSNNLSEYPWNRWLLYTFVGFEADIQCKEVEKIVIPADLVEVFQRTKIGGTTIITKKPKVVLPIKKSTSTTWFTPMLVAIVLLLFAFIGLFRFTRYINVALLSLQTVIGLFLVYLVVFSTLPCTEWNWLLIPFNPLPALLWKWRKRWALGFAVIMMVWDVVMWVYPHQLTDWAYTVLVLALIVMYLGESGKLPKTISTKR